MSRSLDESAVRDALRQVLDPEAGMNIVDLGLVYGIEVSDASVHVDLTMTSAACPMTEMIVDEIAAAVTAVVPPEVGVDVALVWDPPWTPDRMSDLARERFGWSPR
ncbi:MAG TPA: metal-sulfur cluster assembly factor [Burkholderiaceae bacterium]|nr:metal-sulfur cluster assembly factor [Burkholderiaceae bacterium]